MDELLETKTCHGFISLRTVLQTRLLLGFYYPVHQSIARRFLVWIYCFSLTILLSTSIIKILIDRSVPAMFLLPLFTLVIEYNANVIISLLTGEYHIFNFLKGAQLTDGEMGYDHLPFISPATRCIYLTIIFEMIIVLSNFDFSMKGSVIFAIASAMVSLATNLNCLVTVIPLDLLRTRLRLLRQDLKTSLNLPSINNTEDQIKILWHSLIQYRNMIDNLDRSFFWEKLRISLGLSCCFFYFVTNGISFIYALKFNSQGQSIAGWVTVRAMTYLFMCVLPCLSAVFCELVSREVERLKIAIGDQLLSCEDERLQSELEHAAKYLEQRPFSVSIFRICTLNGSLVLALVSLCTSYLIVIVQITGLI